MAPPAAAASDSHLCFPPSPDEAESQWNSSPHRSAIVEVEMSQLELGDKLGDGASGDVFAATLNGDSVALKVLCSA